MLQWVNKLPEKEGWYFMRVMKDGKPVRVVRVFRVAEGHIGAGELAYTQYRGAAWVFLADIPNSLVEYVYWGGPIPEPSVPARESKK